MGLGNAIGIGIPMVNLGLGGGSEPVEERFVISVKTDNAGTSADNQFTLPAPSGGFNYDVETSDGQVFTGLTTDQTFTFPNPGTYDLKISGIFPRINFANKPDSLKLTKVKNWGIIQPNRIIFIGCKNLTEVPTKHAPDLTNVTSLFELFVDCEGLTSLDLNTWDTSTITTLGECFQDCSNLTSLNINNWDVSNVTDMGELVENCSSLVSLDLSNWQTTSLVSLAESFQGASGDIDISNFDLSNVTTLSRCFRGFSGTVDVSGWDTSNISDMSFVFEGTNFGSYGIGEWNTSNATTMLFMLRNSDSFNESLASWDISNVTNFNNFMQGSDGLSIANYNATLIGWAAQTPQNNITISFGSSQYSYEAAAARQTLIDTYGWTITDGGQVAAPEFALKWETTTPNEEIQIGVGSGTFDYTIDWGDGTVESYNTDANISHTYATAGDHITKITGNFPHMSMHNLTDDVYREKLRDVLNWGTIVWQDWTNMFRSCNGFTGLTATDLPNLSNVTSFLMLSFVGNFGNHYNSTVQNWDVSNVTNMSGFSYYGSWRNKISTWDTSNVTSFENFLRSNGNFDNGGDLADMDNFDVSSAINMNWMFNRTTQMENVYIGSWDVSNVTSMNTIFNPLVMSNSGVENWDISNVSNFNQFNAYGQTDISLANWTPISMTSALGFWFNNNSMSTANYDATLISWAAQTLQNNVTFDFGSSQYTLGGAAEAARNTLINTYGWTITDGGGLFVGLLDTYPNSQIAYSLRELSTAFVGQPVVRVRRSDNNAEQDFTATEITDGTLETFVGANDGFVTTWYDQSGNSNNALQSTATLQPKLVTNGVLELENGKPCLIFNPLAVNYLQFSGISSFAFYGVGKSGTSTFERFIERQGGICVRAKSGFYDSTPDPFDWYVSGELWVNNINGLSPNPQIASNIQNLVVAYANTGSTIGIIERISGDSYGARYWRGTMQEIICYTEINNPVRLDIQNNINNHYTIY